MMEAYHHHLSRTIPHETFGGVATFMDVKRNEFRCAQFHIININAFDFSSCPENGISLTR